MTVPRLTRRRLLGVGGALSAMGAVALTVGSATTAAAAVPGRVVLDGRTVPLNQPPDAVIGKLAPPAGADTQGFYAPQIAWPLIPIHASLQFNGHLLTYGTPLGQAQQNGVVWDHWNPATGTGAGAHQQKPGMATYNSFCNAVQPLADDRYVMVGGNTPVASMVYDPITRVETMGPALALQRWYATVLRMPDEKIVVLGGGDYYNINAYRNPANNNGVALVPEVGSGTGPWTLMEGARSVSAFGAERNRWWYPKAFVAPDGAIFGMSDDRMWRMTTAGAGTIADVGRLPFGPGVSGCAVMFEPNRILVCGGGQNNNEDAVVATNRAAIVDISGATPAVAGATAMASARNWHNLTVLSNGEVLANGGTIRGTAAGTANSVYRSEIWNPATGAWRQVASARRIRTYHSAAVLMPSGGVFTGGGGVPGPEDNLNAEMYYPPSLLTRGTDGVVRWAQRAQIVSLGGSVAYGGTAVLGMSDTRRIASVTLIKAGDVTHSLNIDQRRIPLAIVQDGATVRATLPGSRNVLPPGNYLLQAVDAAGVPTPSQIVTIAGSGPGRVTVFEGDESLPGGGEGGGTTPGTVPLTVGSVIGIEPGNFLGRLVRHANQAGRIDVLNASSPPTDRADSSFTVRAGLAGSGVSFESTNVPGRFLRADGTRQVRLLADDGTAAARRNATFTAVPGLAGQGTSFRLSGSTDVYLRHRDFLLTTAVFDGSDLARADSTWRVKPALNPLAPGARISLQPDRAPGSLLRHANFVARVDPIGTGSPAGARADATFVVRAPLGRAGGASLESVNFPGYFLRVVSGGVRLAQRDTSAAFATEATFCPVVGAVGRGVTLRTAADGPPAVRAVGAVVSVADVGTGEDARAAATFLVLPPVG